MNHRTARRDGGTGHERGGEGGDAFPADANATPAPGDARQSTFVADAAKQPPSRAAAERRRPSDLPVHPGHEAHPRAGVRLHQSFVEQDIVMVPIPPAPPRRRVSRLMALLAIGAALALPAAAPSQQAQPAAQRWPMSDVPGSNPIIRDRFTADVAPLTVGDRLYLYAGHDEAKGRQGYTMNEWVAYSTTDMKHWKDHGVIMRPTDFKWAAGEAWASQMVHKNGKYYFYVTVEHDRSHPGKAIGVAVGDTPLGPFRDARGSALVTDNKATWRTWSDIDPTVFTDDDGTSWLAWGNSNFFIAKLKPNMIELDGEPREIKIPYFVEGPWLHKRNGLYYLTYASIDEPAQRNERISYATATSIEGPWTYRGELTGEATNSFTIHAGIEKFKGKWYFFYHDGTLKRDEQGNQFRRAVSAEHLLYNPDGTIRPIVQTREGVSKPSSRKGTPTISTGRPS